MMRGKVPDLEKLKANFRYDPADGSLWARVARSKRAFGKARSGGYGVVFQDGKSYYAHRVAWFLATGEWPDFIIDHANGDGMDNKWSNLRKSNWSLNQANRGIQRTNTTGIKGVYSTENGKFGARIKVNGKLISLGRFTTKEAAADAYRIAAVKHFGDHAHFG